MQFRTLLIPLLFIVLFSCAKRKQIIDGGKMENGESWEMYTEHDSCFRVFHQGNFIVRMHRAASVQEMRDSTFTEVDYYMSGRISDKKSFVHKMDDGVWESWYDTGEKQAWSRSEKGGLVEYRSWYKNGHPHVEGTSPAGKGMQRKEYFENGNPDQQFALDSVGNGHCIKYFPNGKLRTEGDVHGYSQAIGIWHQWDSLGNVLRDTLYGMPQLSH